MWAAFKLLPMAVKTGLIIGVLAVLLAIIGSTYTIGYNKGVNIAAVQIGRYETASAKVTTKIRELQGKDDVRIVTEYKDRVQYVDRIQYKTKTVVQTLVPEQYQLSKGWVHTYNQSVAGALPDDAKASDPVGSGVSDRTALFTITENNAICLTNAAQLTSLQDWIKSVEKNREEATK
jgi:hypothetical protein